MAGVDIFPHSSCQPPSIMRHSCLKGPQVTDAVLEHLNGLTNLDRLWLYNTQITNTGLENLKGLTKLEKLMPRPVPLTALR